MTEVQIPQVKKTREQRQEEFEKRYKEDKEFALEVEKRKEISMRTAERKRELVKANKERVKETIKKMDEMGIQVIYSMCPKGIIGYRIVEQEDKREMHIAHAFCSKKDIFNKHTGRTLIIDRLTKMPQKYTLSVPITEELASIGEIANRIAVAFVVKKFKTSGYGLPQLKY